MSQLEAVVIFIFLQILSLLSWNGSVHNGASLRASFSTILYGNPYVTSPIAKSIVATRNSKARKMREPFNGSESTITENPLFNPGKSNISSPSFLRPYNMADFLNAA